MRWGTAVGPGAPARCRAGRPPRAPCLGSPGPGADPSAPRRHEAHDALDRRGLPGAVAAEQRHRLAFAHLERDVVQDVALAVEGIDAEEAEDGLAGRGLGSLDDFDERLALTAQVDPLHFRVPRTSSGAPSTSTAPSFITVIRSANANTRSMSCSTSSTAICAARRSTSPTTRSRSAAAGPGQRLVQQQERVCRPARRRSPSGAGRRRTADRPAPPRGPRGRGNRPAPAFRHRPARGLGAAPEMEARGSRAWTASRRFSGP